MLDANVDRFFVSHEVEIAPSSHHHARAGWINLDCPYCSPGSKRFRLGFRVKQKYFNCWTCGPVPFKKTLYLLFNNNSKEFIEQLEDFRLPKEDQIIGKYTEPAGLLDKIPKPYYDYLRSRFGKETSLTIERYKLRAIGPRGKHLACRIFVPLYYKGEKATWTTRSIDPEIEIRYKNAPIECEAISIKKLLFGEDFVRHSVIVVEGPFDAMRIGPGAVSLGGVNYSKAQVRKLAQYPYRYICLDQDEAGQKTAEKLANELSVFPGETSILQLNAKDAGSCSLKELNKIRKLLC